MNKRSFLSQLFALYPSDNENLEMQFKYYDEILESKNTYDYSAFLTFIGREYKYRTTPTTQWLIEKREKFRTVKPVNDGELLRITLESGLTIDLTVCGLGQTLGKAKEIITGCYGPIKQIDKYPKGTVIIGNKVWAPNTK